MPNYVKFQRGSEQAYNNLAVKNQDTLYFVYDGQNPTAGKLYLGERLLSGIGEGTSVKTINDLEDVIITGTPGAGSFLVYSEGAWSNKGVNAVAAMIAKELSMTIDVDTSQLKLNATTGKLELLNFSGASSGAIAFKGSDGTLNWGTPKIISDISNELTNLSNSLESVIDEKISSLNHLTYKKVGDLNEATENNTIYLISNPDSEIKNNYLEYLVVDGVPELLGNLNTGSVNLDGYATVERVEKLENKFTAVVGDITKLTTYNADNPQTIIQELNAINERLKWEDIPV